MLRVFYMLAFLLGAALPARGELLSLGDCLVRAAASNRELKASALEIASAQEQVRIAGSGLLPRVNLQAGYQAQQAPQAIQLNTTVETQEPNFAFLNFTVYDTLYDFGRTAAREGEARLSRDAVRHRYAEAEQGLFLQVVRAYYGILEAEKLVLAANDEAVQMSAHLKTARALFEEGVVTRNDLLQAEVRVAASRQKLFSAENAVNNGWLELNYLTGQPPDTRGELKEEIVLPSLTETGGGADFSRRGEIAAQRALVGAREQGIREAKSDFYPELFAKLSLDYVQNDKVREQAIMAAVVGFKVNLFDGMVTSARLRQALQARARDEERLRDLEARAALELAQARNDLKVAAARIKVAEQAIQQGVENLRITRDRYQEKVGTATEVVDAQTLLTQTRTDYYRSIFDLQVAAARVKRATGTL